MKQSKTPSKKSTKPTPKTTTAPAPAPVALSAVYLPVGALAPSPTNPRKQFDPAALEELAASIRVQGIIQPLVVRPIPTGLFFVDEIFHRNGKTPTSTWQVLDRRLIKNQCYHGPQPKEHTTRKEAEAALPTHEIVCGERRWRASQLASQAQIPCIIRTLADKEVSEIQTIENLQRQDLHPLEEAEGYEHLLTQGFTVDTLCARIGKKRGYIYGRLKLTALCDKARKAFYAGELTASVALLVARIPHASLQEQALKDLVDFEGEPLSYRAASAVIFSDYTLKLERAPFDIKDPKLPGGPCANCPKRTGNNKDLYADCEDPNVCTDPQCHAAKRDASTARQAEALKAKGLKMLTDAEKKRVWPWHDDQVAWNAPFVPVTDQCMQDPKKRTYEQIIKSHNVPVTELRGAIDPEGGAHTLCDPKAICKAAGLDTQSVADAENETNRKYQEEEKQRQADCDAITSAIVRACETNGTPEGFWHALAAAAITQVGFYVAGKVAKRRGIKPSDREHLASALQGYTDKQASALVLELISHTEDDSNAFLKLYGLDASKVLATRQKP